MLHPAINHTHPPTDFYVVTSTKGVIDFTREPISEQQLGTYGFSVGPERDDGCHGLYRGGNRVALLFANRDALSTHLSAYRVGSSGFSPDLLGWWFA